MSTTFCATGLGRTAASTRRVSSILKECWNAFQERRQRRRLRAILCDLSDRELMDFGASRGEIDYVASNRDVDPRGIRSARSSIRQARRGRLAKVVVRSCRKLPSGSATLVGESTEA